MKIYQALAKAGALSDLGVSFIYTRHEHAAVAAATAYARTTGRVGVATVTCGPGLTQIMTILPIAVKARIPLVLFAGEAPLHKVWYNQGIEQRPFVEACGAEYRALHETTSMVTEVHQAFAAAKNSQQPIVVGVPFDLQQQAWEDEEDVATSKELFNAPPAFKPDASAIAQAAAMVSSAKRVVVLAGLGAIHPDARSACIALAEESGACLATTLPAKGLFHDEPFNLGVAGGYASEGAKEIFAEADLVVGIGARLASHTFDGGRLTPNAKVIHIDIDPQETVQGRTASDLKIKSDAQLGTDALSKAVRDVNLNNASNKTDNTGNHWRTEDMRKQTAAAITLPDVAQHATPDGSLHPMAVVKKLSEVIPPHCHIVNTSGHCAYYTAQMNHHPQSHYTVIRDFGAIGNGTSFAMGIAAAHPQRPVVLLDGDGSALMNIQELETMHRHGLHILIIIFNDGAYGSEVHKLRADGVSEAGSVFGRADFAAIGQGFGLTGKTFTDLETLPASMNDFLNQQSSTVWDIHISDQIASPQILKAHKAAHS